MKSKPHNPFNLTPEKIGVFGGEPTRISISADLGASMLRELTDANYLLNEILDYTPWHARSGPLYEKIKQFLDTY